MLRTAIVGAGGIAWKHAEGLKRIPDIEVAGVLDTNPENARRLADFCGARAITEISDILDEVDMIHLLTPPSKRVSYAQAAMEAGKHVLCEKPVAGKLSDALALQKLANENDVFFMTAFNMRFRPGYKMLQNDVLSGKLGDIISVWIQRVGPGSGFNTPLGDSWRTDPNLVCGMTIESLSHDIDMLYGFGMEIESVGAWVHGSKKELPAFDNNAQVLMRLTGGKNAVINASWASHLPLSSRGVIGTKGTAVISGDGFFDFMSYRIVTEDMPHEKIIRVNDLFDAESYYSENVYFIDCIKKGILPEITVENGVRALRVSESILKSAKTGVFVEVSK